MKKILVVDDVKEITEVIVMILEIELEDYEFLEFSSGNQTINYLKHSNDNVELIISDHNMPDGTGSDLYSFIRENNLNIPYIHMSTGNYYEFEKLLTLLEDHSANACINKPFDDETLLATVINSLNISNDKSPKEFTKLKISRISEHINDFFKIYINIDGRPILLFDDSDSSDMTKLQELNKKGLESILIETQEYNDWIKMKMHDLNSIIGECSFEDPKTVTDMTDTLMRQSALLVNMSNPKILNIKKMNNSVNQVLINLWEKPEINKGLINHFTKLSYLSGHSANCLILSWLYTRTIKNGDLNLFSKLAQASILHDISIDKDELSMIISKEMIEKSSLSSTEKKYIIQHPIISAEKIEKCGIHDSDVLRIIRDHHELPDASGFPNSLSMTNTHKLSTAFQFILQLAHRLYINKGQLDKSLDTMNEVFNVDDYRPLINSLKR